MKPTAREDQRSYWDERYANADVGGSMADEWIDRYLLSGTRMLDVLELGAGLGHLSGSLASRGHRVVATEISPVAVQQMKERLSGVTVLELDHSQQLPFPDAAFDAVIADLCLHYFDSATTTSILSEISRVLKPEGMLLARVNSAADVRFGAGAGTEIEHGFYEKDGHFKRFFDEEMIKRFWGSWRELRIRREVTLRFGPPKELYEIVARRPAAALRQDGRNRTAQ